ncbi:unnamed protein product [Paramecium octaurelia]|uniref:protein-tyrosine-phosphatase n=1 Tax=Paramecium octaurelia TaxID=43137 RepID=A0A8S1XLG5_PAROT|nr:unnamed protein product [Paramecium octaurelia]
MNSSQVYHIISDKFHSLYMSNIHAADQLNLLRSRNLRTIICVDKTPSQHHTDFARYYQVFLQDNKSTQQLQNICELIQNGLKLSSILVVCNNGLQGAPTIVIAYLISRGWNYEKAFYYVKEKHNLINPSLQSKKQLIEFYGSVSTQQPKEDEFTRFTQVLKEMWDKQDYFESSPCFDPLTDSFQDDGTKTPGFISPTNVLKMRNSIRKPASRKSSMIRSTSCNQKSDTNMNYSFHFDEIRELNQEQKQEIMSPSFLQVQEICEEEEEELVRLRHRRHRRNITRNKSANQKLFD